MDHISPQLPPKNGNTRVVDKVLVDVSIRTDAGHRKYGTYLRTNNGRDALVDAYQEAIDLVMYLAQAIMERDEQNGQHT